MPRWIRRMTFIFIFWWDSWGSFCGEVYCGAVSPTSTCFQVISSRSCMCGDKFGCNLKQVDSKKTLTIDIIVFFIFLSCFHQFLQASSSRWRNGYFLFLSYFPSLTLIISSFQVKKRQEDIDILVYFLTCLTFFFWHQLLQASRWRNGKRTLISLSTRRQTTKGRNLIESMSISLRWSDDHMTDDTLTLNLTTGWKHWQVFVHSGNFTHSDLALLKLQHHLDFREGVMPICLPQVRLTNNTTTNKQQWQLA